MNEQLQIRNELGNLPFLPIFIFTLLMVSLVVGIKAVQLNQQYKSHAISGCPSMNFVPTKLSVAPGDSFSVTITTCGNSIDPVNAVESKFSFDTNLLIDASVDDSTSSFELPVVQTIRNGVVDISRGAAAPINSAKILTVSTVHFTVAQNATGVIRLQFDPASQLINSKTNINELSVLNSKIIKIASGSSKSLLLPLSSASAVPLVP